MTIRENIIRVQQRFLNGDTALADRLRAQALAAIYAGIGTPEWETFMRNFATPGNEIELARLTTRRVEDETGNKRYVGLARAYLVANITCTTGTADNLLQGIEDILDRTLPPQSPQPIEPPEV